MSSINDGVDFIYNGISSKEYGIKLATSIGSITRSNNIEVRDIVISNNSTSKTFGFHGIKYTSPNTFDLIIYKEDGSFINEYEERQLKKWLMSSNMHWLYIDQDTLNNIEFYCIGTKAEMIDIGAYSGGMLISFQCDSTSAWSKQIRKSYTTVGSTLNIKLRIDTDYDDEIIKPTLIITPKSNGDISIQSITRNEIVTITDCSNDETIILDGLNGKVNTSGNGLLINRWNKQFLKLQDGVNSITLTGDFTFQIQYRQQIRIGG